MPFLTIDGIEVLVVDLAEREPEYIGDIGRTYNGTWRGDTSGEIRAWIGTGLEVPAADYHALRSAVRRGTVEVQGDALYGGWSRRMRVTMSGEYVRDGAGYLIVPGFTMEDAQVHDLIVRYFPGLNLLTHSRASSATYTASDETIETVASNILRDAHYIDGDRTTLLELQRTNLLLWSEAFDNAAWGKDASVTVTANTGTAPDGATSADRTQYDGTATATTKLLNQTPAITSGAQYAISGWARRHPSQAADQTFRLYGDNGSDISADFTATSEWQRFTLVFTGGSTGNKFHGIMPGSGNAAFDIELWGLQLEGAFPTSYIKTEASTVTRAVDIASYALPDAIASPRTPWVRYTRWIAGMDGNGGVSNPFAWQVGDGSSASPRLYMYWHSATALRVVHANAAFDFSTVTGLSVSRGGTVEAVVRWNGDGTGTLAVSINGGAVQSATLPGITPAAAWNGGANTYLNSRDGGNNAGAMALQRDAFKEGVPSDVTADELMAYMRGEAA